MMRLLPRVLIAVLFLALAPAAARAQLQDDIPIAELPAEVQKLLGQYTQILLTSKTLDECAEKFTPIAGGLLVNEDGESLRGGIQPFSLKKDYTNIKYYAQPLKITRVKRTVANGEGFGPSAIAGKRYTIWIAKKSGVGGTPAPVSIIVPENHEFVKTPKVTGIGSL